VTEIVFEKKAFVMYLIMTIVLLVLAYFLGVYDANKFHEFYQQYCGWYTTMNPNEIIDKLFR